VRMVLPWLAGLVLALAGPVLSAPLDEIREVLREQALRPPAEAALAALKGEGLDSGLKGIDPYARYFPARDGVAAVPDGVAGAGIGAELIARGRETFLAVYAGGPAHRAGVPDRSRLLSVEGRDVAGRSAREIADMLRGKAGRAVNLTVVTPGGDRRGFRMVREAFRPLDVEAVPEMRVLRIRAFTAGMTRPAFLAALNHFGPSLQSGPVVVDLRDAGGGDLYEAFDLAGMFLPAGALLGTMTNRDGGRREFRASKGPKLAMPLVILIGPDTASAAEVFAGILRRHGRAGLVGLRSYGKCSSQTDAHLSDGSVLRFTNSEVLLPDGTSCSGKGLEPDRTAGGASFDRLEALVREARSLAGATEGGTP